MSGLFLLTVSIFGCLLAYRLGRRLRRGRVRREAIDIDLVLEEKYPNRRRAVVEELAAEPVAALVLTAAGPARDWPEPAQPAAWFPPPNTKAPGWVPVPGEPGGDEMVGPPRRPARVVHTPDGPGLVATPYEALRRRRDRVATQAAAAFAEVHELRTESLRRASQAEHNSELATTARVRATRMARESRRYEAQGRLRSHAVPDAVDAFHDVHRFRVEALRRAQEAEHGAEAVARARERATRLLQEQRRIEAEMNRLRRGGWPGETL